ncbi:hypothetical protein [Nitrosarchaeum sp. AC2]|uniref:hypothetical protein n=1 Tax=Nitrosarchaeum sp. AC2 TaxID=2259673 RepID=UPI0015CAC449|nr:hypothetical protein [Nitrosarchaeum sp. AC2]QLH10102.1 hypothetical protein DSQ20_00160 [Nitrosarchaeum sp. AC2]
MKFIKVMPLLLLGFFVLVSSAYGETINQSMEGSMDIQITHPDEAIVGRIASISVLIKNNGWEDKQDISFIFTSQDNSMIPILDNNITIKKLSQGSSFGGSIDFKISSDVNPGIHFLNVKYSQVLVSNNKEPQEPSVYDIAIPIVVKNEPSVIIHTITPDAIFTNAEFPFIVEIISKDIEISNVNVEIIPPRDIQFRGETLHSFSNIQKNSPIIINSRIISPIEEVNTEYKMPFNIIVRYTDDVGEEKIESQAISVILRPRTFMELTTDGGIWIGDFFIAPYVSIGTIIGIPAGAIISLLIRKSQKSTKKRLKKRKE